METKKTEKNFLKNVLIMVTLNPQKKYFITK